MEENKVPETTAVEKEGSKFGWGVLGFFVPILGLILFLVWRKSKAKTAKALGIGALVGGIVWIIATVIEVIMFFSVIKGADITSLETDMVLTTTNYKTDVSSIDATGLDVLELSKLSTAITNASIENYNILGEYTLDDLYPYMKEYYKSDAEELAFIEDSMKKCTGYMNGGKPYVKCGITKTPGYNDEDYTYRKNNKKPLLTAEDILKNAGLTEKTASNTSDKCSVQATKGDKDYLYNYSYDESCDTVYVLDDNYKTLFTVRDDKVTLDGEELSYPDKSFLKVDNSIVLYSYVCSPGLCYIYVYNTSTNKGFKHTTLSTDNLLVPTARSIEIDSNKNMVVTIRTNTSAGMEGMRDDPRVILLGKIMACEVTDIDAYLSEASLEDFGISETYTYKYSNKEITNDPTVKVTETIKDLFKSQNATCSR